MTDRDDYRVTITAAGTSATGPWFTGPRWVSASSLDEAHARILDFSRRLDERTEQVQALRDMLAAEREQHRIASSADVAAVAKLASDFAGASEARLFAKLAEEFTRLTLDLADDHVVASALAGRTEMIAALAVALGRRLCPAAKGGEF